ncbi:esterase-like activity of phytase family protein [Aquabacter sp. L1I39]|uniref:esterase-like activity of phytase family protein n=1 Tax=Aquabacter sp. L1I39 TaxID=2820278 RepID=UPI001ADA9620|nr:esterase-like activity of phytase family protein [Aquabacter sp. L1I39]QTL04255.1 esterase-like activity of phytase family protein [Aquabacter sp. L1I39]
MMTLSPLRRTLIASAAALGLLTAGPAFAQQGQTSPIQASQIQGTQIRVPTPLVAKGAGDAPVTTEGQAFQNLGLVGVARVPADVLDFMGDTLGSMSGMAIAPGTWRKEGDTYRATLYSLPDRGRNSPDEGEYVDYANRLMSFDLAFVPGQAFTLTPTGGIALKDFEGRPTTGADPADGTRMEAGHTFPSPKPGALGAGKVSLDAEAIAMRADGSFYVSDEYGPGIYLFGPGGRMKGAIDPGPALAPMTGGALNFNSTKAPDTGRRNNQGLEALAVTPDGRKLVAVLQSATIQDSSASKDQTNRANTRILVYDIAADPTPKAPVAVYALTLPVYASRGDGKIDRTAAQSEMVALDDHRFLILARDGNGLGSKPGPEVFKAVLLVDVSGATNLAGTDYETTTRPIAPAQDGRNVLDPSIRPATADVLVNLLNPDDLGKFGLNIHNETPDENTLSEKWEAMALVPALDPQAPDTFFLFVGNDNDFLTRHGVMQGKPYADKIDNATTVLAYRLRLPGVKLAP